MSIGIYIIKNIKTNKFYIGKSINIEKRIKSHFNRAVTPSSKEFNCPLYKDIRKYKKECFVYQILETCKKEELDEKEIYWIKKLEARKYGYNLTPGGTGIKELNKGEGHPHHILSQKDVEAIRTRYNNKERKKEVYKDYEELISKSGFHKIWNGATWQDVMPEVFTEDNKNFHKHNSANTNDENGRARFTNEEILFIREQKRQQGKIDEIYEMFKTRVTFASFKNIWYGCNWKSLK